MKYLILLSLCIVSILLGARMLFSHDFFFLADQGRDFLLVKDIVVNHHLTLIGTHSGLGGVFHGPLWLYLLTPIFILGKGDPFYFAAFYALIPVIGVLIGFFLFRRLYSDKVGLIFSFFFAFSPSIFGYITNTIGVNLVPVISIFLFYFLILFIRGKSYAFPFLCFFVGILFQFETAIALGFVPGTIAVILINWRGIKNIRNLVFGGFALILSISTFILFDIRHQFLITKSLFSIFSSPKGSGYLYFPERIISHIQSLSQVYLSFLFNNSVVLILTMLIILGLFALSYKKLTNKSERKEIALLSLFPFLVFAVFIFYSYTIWQEYTLALVIPVFLALSIIIEKITSQAYGKITFSLFVIVTLIFSMTQIRSQYLASYQNTSAGSYKNQKTVTDWILKDAGSSKFGYFVYTPETFTYGMDYLMYYEGKKINISPINTKQEVNYLIMYPADEKAHDFWKKNVVRTSGKVLETKKFLGDIIVEKVQQDPNEGSVDPNYYQNLIFR